MVLLQAIIEVFVRSMKYLIAQCFTHCSRVRGMTVRRDPFRGLANNGESLFEKLLGGLISRFSLRRESTRLPSASMAR